MSKTPEDIWLSIPEKHRTAMADSCWCSKCRDSVSIVNYVVKTEKGTLILDGSCQYCQGRVMRVVD